MRGRSPTLKKRQRWTQPPRARAPLYSIWNVFLFTRSCHATPDLNAAQQPRALCSVLFSFKLHATSLRAARSYFIFHFFVRCFRKMLFSFTGYHRSKCTYRFHSILFRTTEAESGHCTGTHTLARTERDTSIRISMTLELEFYYFYYNFMFVNGERVQSHGSCSAVAHTHTHNAHSRESSVK